MTVKVVPTAYGYYPVCLLRANIQIRYITLVKINQNQNTAVRNLYGGSWK